jgi:hypothetical protein
LYGFAIFHVSAATVSGLVVASVFPLIAYFVLGLAVLVDLRGVALPGVLRDRLPSTRG